MPRALNEKEWGEIHDTVVELKNEQLKGLSTQEIEATERRLIRTMVIADTELRHHEDSYLLIETAIKAVQEMLPGGKTRNIIDAHDQPQIKALLNHQDDNIRKEFVIKMAQAHFEFPNNAEGFLRKIKEIAVAMTPKETSHFRVDKDTFI